MLARQDGVITRRQLMDLGWHPHDLKRMLRRRDLTRVHPGIFVHHNGPLTRRQREWTAVLAAWPAALSDESVLPGDPPAMVHVAVAHGRAVQLPSGTAVRRIAGSSTSMAACSGNAHHRGCG